MKKKFGLTCSAVLLCLISSVFADKKVIYEIQAPDGEIYEVEAPEGTSELSLRLFLAEHLLTLDQTKESLQERQSTEDAIEKVAGTRERVEPGILSQAADFVGDLFSGEDDSRQRYRECRQMAIARYNELLEEAMFDPGEQWALDGFESPRHYARAYSDGTYRLCMD